MGLLDDAIREHLELKRRRGADAGAISKEESEALGPVRRGPDGAPDLTDTLGPGEAAAPAAPAAGAEWDSDQTAVLGTTPGAHDPPPAVTGYEPPSAPAADPPPGGYAAPPVPSHEPTTSLPAYEPPAPPPTASPPESDRPWFERAHDESEPAAVGPEPEQDPEPEPEHPSLLSRFRVGRRSKHEPPPAAAFDDEAGTGHGPPPLPAGAESASAYEPPPPTGGPPPYSFGFDPAGAQHESDIVPADEEPDVEDVLEETPDFLEETPEHDRLWFEQRPPRDFDFDD